MAYNFKSLGEVELLNTMPENANVLVEVDGATRRAPKEDGISKLVTVEALAEVPEGATVLAEVNGEIKRVPGEGLGGGKVLIIKSSDFDNAVAGVAAAKTEAVEVTYTANMTFDEIMEAFVACELNSLVVYSASEEYADMQLCQSIVYDVNSFVVPCFIILGDAALYLTAEGISTTAPESASTES